MFSQDVSFVSAYKDYMTPLASMLYNGLAATKVMLVDSVRHGYVGMESDLLRAAIRGSNFSG